MATYGPAHLPRCQRCPMGQPQQPSSECWGRQFLPEKAASVLPHPPSIEGACAAPFPWLPCSSSWAVHKHFCSWICKWERQCPKYKLVPMFVCMYVHMYAMCNIRPYICTYVCTHSMQVHIHFIHRQLYQLEIRRWSVDNKSGPWPRPSPGVKLFRVLLTSNMEVVGYLCVDADPKVVVHWDHLLRCLQAPTRPRSVNVKRGYLSRCTGQCSK